MRAPILLIALLILLSSQALWSQDKRASHARVTLKDGTLIKAEVVSIDDSLLILESPALGELRLKREEVERIEFYDPLQEDPDAPFNAFPPFYQFSPSSNSIEKGSVYYRNSWVLFNSAVFGLTDRISLETGLFGLPIDYFPFITFIQPKATIPIGEQLTASLGGYGVFAYYDNEFDGIAAGIGRLSLGDPNRNLSLGIGYGSPTGENNFGAFALAGGTLTVSQTIKVMTDNVIFSEGVFGITGIRYNKPNFSFDAGLFYFGGDGLFQLSPIPYFGLAVRL